MQEDILVVPRGGEVSLPRESDAFTFGAGLFETLKLSGGRLCFFEAHWQRMSDSAAALGWTVPGTPGQVLDAVRELVRGDGITDGIIKLSLVKAGERNRIYVYSRSAKAFPTGTTRLCLSAAKRNEASLLVTHKSHNYLENTILGAQARDAGYRDCLFLNTRGMVAETSSANVYWVNDGTLFTPSVETGILPGTVRTAVLEIARELGVPVQSGGFPIDDLRRAQSLFLTSAISGLVVVDEYEDADGVVAFGPVDPVIERISARFTEVEKERSVDL